MKEIQLSIECEGSEEETTFGIYGRTILLSSDQEGDTEIDIAEDTLVGLGGFNG